MSDNPQFFTSVENLSNLLHMYINTTYTTALLLHFFKTTYYQTHLVVKETKNKSPVRCRPLPTKCEYPPRKACDDAFQRVPL